MISLRKELPVASGIGGGSADAAAAIRGLSALWGLPEEKLSELTGFAAKIGSDVPVCLNSATAWMEGRGERVTRLPDLPESGVVLVNPGISISTADVFRRLTIRANARSLRPGKAFSSVRQLIDYLGHARNDLELPARELAPIIGEVLEALKNAGAAFARMSGSGATCFGLFASKNEADAATRIISKAKTAWWVRATRFVSSDAAKPVAQ